jgi:hypothetical protein
MVNLFVERGFVFGSSLVAFFLSVPSRPADLLLADKANFWLGSVIRVGTVVLQSPELVSSWSVVSVLTLLGVAVLLII